MDKALEILKKLEKMGEEKFIPSIGPMKGKILAKVFKEHNPKTILEIGTLFGYSAILMATLAKGNGKIKTIEVREDCAEKALLNIKKAGLSSQIELLVGNALEIIPTLNETFDLLFLDADKKEYFDYFTLAKKNLKKRSVVVADNVCIFKKDMLNYLDFIRNSDNFESKTIDVPLEFSENVPDAMEISVKI